MDEIETIRLLGGPMDGHVQAWRGGHIIKFQEAPPVKIMTEPPANPSTFSRPITHVYRRAMYEPGLFTWQGVEP